MQNFILTGSVDQSASAVLYYENFDFDSVVTPVEPQVLENLLRASGYPQQETEFLVQGFREGFPLHYQGNRNRQTTANNLKIRVGSKLDMWNKVMTEVKESRYIGPLREIPYSTFIQSPIGLVPKHGGKTRLITHLSWPHQDSVNSNIPDHLCTTSYPSFQEAIQMLMEIAPQGNLFIAKVDCKNAFRVIPFRKQDFRWLVIKAEHPTSGQEFFFIEKCLSFGSSISCAHYQRFSNCLAHLFVNWERVKQEISRHLEIIHRNIEEWQITGNLELNQDKFQSPRIHNYLDDFLTGNTSTGSCNQLVVRFIYICAAIGVPLAADKIEWASAIQVFLGLLINTITRTISIPLEKREVALQQLDTFLRAKKVTVLDIQKLGGRLNFFCKAIYPGRAFTRRIQNKADGLRQYHHVRVDAEMKCDLRVWFQFLEMEDMVCRPFVDFSKVLQADRIECSSDASGKIGFGCRWGKLWTWGTWDTKLLEEVAVSIQFQELYAVTVAIELFAHKLENRRVIVQCDNQAVVSMVNNLTSKAKDCMKLIRLIALTSMIHNVRFFCEYVRSEDNGCSDALSRNQLTRFFELAGDQVNEVPEDIPAHLWPLKRSWWNV